VEHHESITYQVVDNVSLELLRSPTVPMAPSNPLNVMSLVKKVAALAAAAMVLLMGVLAFYRDTVRSSSEAKSKLDCDLLGSIPHERKYKGWLAWLRRRRSSILVTNPTTSFRFVETFNKLASRVGYHMHGKKVVMVSSILANEGKSTVSVNLAMAMALKHEKVLLIDCDLRKPSCCELVEQAEIPYGLCAVLNGEVDVNDALIEDRKSGLCMLLETKATQDSDDYLSSERMHALLKWARENFDFVVLDLPPMSLVSDAESLMELADASVLVVRQNMAKTNGINKAISILESGKAKLLGCVLNDVRSSAFGAGGYGYGYGRYGKYGHYGHYGHYGKYGHYGYYGKYSQYHGDQENQ
jgi:capsular exopolysaccharide synthesis family protein